MLALPFGWTTNKWLLVIGNTVIGIACIALSFTAVWPLSLTDFLFFSFVLFLAALYRPGWMFLLLIGMLPYEIINVAPIELGLTLRPYQWLLVLITLALFLRIVLKRFPLEKFVPNKWDVALLIFGLGAILSASFSTVPKETFRLTIILFSFLLLYFICRLFVRSVDDARTLLPFLFSSFFVISIFAIIQNILFLSGKESLEIMAGRPNATFPEADWLGGYLAMLLTASVSLIVSPYLLSAYASIKKTRFVLSCFIFFGMIALLLTVSRSAWLATFCGVLTAFLLFAWQRGIFDALYWENRQVLKRAFAVALFVVGPSFLAIMSVFFFQLTPFDLWDRSKSLSSGLQKITIACEQETILPEHIATVEDLIPYDCFHIRLEEREEKRAEGMYVTEIFRNDPNVHLRGDIYKETITLLKTHWFLGIGFGAIGNYLGTDERGAKLNASNLFLEIWLGAGSIGCIAFLFFIISTGWYAIKNTFSSHAPLALTLTALWVSSMVFNLFNAGLFLGWLFLLFALFVIIIEHPYGK
ncbi:MAG: O-antigen ligase family protein [Candidatus Moranbacteria bacterium]|nr:O-antigen ligase family protein [Candidatus Moranbacteria bacterium]